VRVSSAKGIIVILFVLSILGEGEEAVGSTIGAELSTRQRQERLREKHWRRIRERQEYRQQRQRAFQRSYRPPVRIQPPPVIYVRPCYIYAQPLLPFYPTLTPILPGQFISPVGPTSPVRSISPGTIPFYQRAPTASNSAQTLHNNLWTHPQRYQGLDLRALEEDAETLHDNLWKYPHRYGVR